MSSFDQPSFPADDAPRAAPGWYPVDAVSMRYWDGYEWTNDMAPLHPPAGGHASGPAGYATPGVPATVSENDRTYAMIMHLGGMFFSFIVPLVMWLVKKDESPFIDYHGKQIMNFHLTIWIAVIISFVLVLVLIGIFMLLILAVGSVVLTIVGAVAAYRGEYFKYPAIPFFS